MSIYTIYSYDFDSREVETFRSVWCLYILLCREWSSKRVRVDTIHRKFDISYFDSSFFGYDIQDHPSHVGQADNDLDNLDPNLPF